ncbi:hypothetical protein, partial [Pseudomonas aeruginosa]|uniref:hypothetical protein n=1 Tax=Pseudomonas aeruginosa TaxID=287 RepID=UPI003CC582A2
PPPGHNQSDALAPAATRHVLDFQMRAIPVSLLQMQDGPKVVEALVGLWLELHAPVVERWRALVVVVRAASGSDLGMYGVAFREVLVV